MNKILFQEEGHIYTTPEGRAVPSVSEILQHFGISDFSHVDGRVLEAAQKFGTVVHQTCHLYDINDLAECDPKVQPYLDQWIKFCGDLEAFDVIELPLYSDIWGFAGTPDRLLYEKVIDIKTGTETASHKIQTAMYQILIEENIGIKIKERMTVYLKPDSYKVVTYKNRFDLTVAKSLITAYNFKKREGLF